MSIPSRNLPLIVFVLFSFMWWHRGQLNCEHLSFLCTGCLSNHPRRRAPSHPLLFRERAANFWCRDCSRCASEPASRFAELSIPRSSFAPSRMHQELPDLIERILTGGERLQKTRSRRCIQHNNRANCRDERISAQDKETAGCVTMHTLTPDADRLFTAWLANTTS